MQGKQNNAQFTQTQALLIDNNFSANKTHFLYIYIVLFTRIRAYGITENMYITNGNAHFNIKIWDE